MPPLTHKGEEIKKAMTKEYGAKKGEEVLYASKNAGTITGIDKDCMDAASRLASGAHISGRDRKAMNFRRK